jgi:hypothetical protein
MTMSDSERAGRVYRSPMRLRGAAGLLVAVLVLAGCGDDDADQADPPAVSADHEEVADPAIAVVVSALDAKNRFDLDGWLMAFEGGKRQGIPLFADEILMNANQHWEVVEPCQVTAETGSGQSVVECVISNTDDFWGAGGIFDTKNQRFTVNADELITDSNSFSSDRRDSFNRAFHQWLSDTHPDVYASMDPGYISSAGPGFDTQNPGHMLVAVDYVEEFVAQSDTYPLDPTEQ